MSDKTIYKVCPQCKQGKNIVEFYKDRTKTLAVTTYCKKCSNARRKNYPLKNKEYYSNNRKTAKIKFNSIKTNCPRRGVGFNLNREEFYKWYEGQKKNCAYCGRTLSRFKKGDDGLTIDRLDNSIGYELANIVLCCWRCNIIKGYWFTSQEMLEIANKYLRKGEK